MDCLELDCGKCGIFLRMDYLDLGWGTMCYLLGWKTVIRLG